MKRCVCANKARQPALIKKDFFSDNTLVLSGLPDFRLLDKYIGRNLNQLS
jgi:hypothetical protein